MDITTFFLITQLLFILLFLAYILLNMNKEKLNKLNRELLVNEIQIKLNESYKKSLDYMDSLTNVINCSSDFSQLTAETLGEILKLFSSQYYIPNLIMHNIHIGLPEFEISFKTPEDGHLYIKAASCEVSTEDKAQLMVKNELSNMLILKGQKVTIKNIKNPDIVHFYEKVNILKNIKNKK